MAKRPVKQQAAKRPAKASTKSAPAKAKSATVARSVAKPVARAAAAVVAKRGAPAAAKKPVAKPAAKAPAAKSAKPAAKSAVAAKPVVAAKPAAKPIAKAAAPAKVATKPAPAAKPAVAAKPAATAKAAEPAPAAAEAPKVSTGFKLSQGPFVSTALTKRGTFAPNKLSPPPSRLPVKRPAPVAVVPPPPVAPPLPPVATADKAAKNRAGLSPKDLEFFRELLLAKRRELLGDMSSNEREALRENNSDLSTLPVHMADQGTDAYEQEFTLRLVEEERGLLRELNNALAKIQNGTYGLCEGTGLPIAKPRLEAQPWAKYSIEHARALEKRKMMFRR